MPLYEFEDGSGQVIERICPGWVEELEEDGRKYRRRAVHSVTMLGTAREDTQQEGMRRALHHLENVQGSNWRSRYSKDTHKRVWGL